MRTFREKTVSGITIEIYPHRKEKDDHWSWYPHVYAREGKTYIELSGRHIEKNQWTYEEAKELGESWAKSIQKFLDIHKGGI